MAEQCKLDFSTIPELTGRENLVKGWNDLRKEEEEENSAIWLGNNQSIYFQSYLSFPGNFSNKSYVWLIQKA